jgi:hypothetical protein
MTYDTIEVSKLTGGCGAEISGVDLKAMSNRQWNEVQQAFVEHGVIFFRDQDLTPEQHIEFAQRWAPIDINRFFPAVAGYPQIAEVRKEPEGKKNIGNLWHTDHSYDQKPAMGSILLAREVPDEGGDTLFANMYLAFETLSEGMKKMLRGLSAVHSSVHVFGPKNDRGAMGFKGTDQVGDAERPRGALRERRLHHAVRGLDRRGQQAAARAALSPCRAARIHLPLPLAQQLDRLLGQSRHLALRGQRLSWRAPADASHHRGRLRSRSGGLIATLPRARPMGSARSG